VAGKPERSMVLVVEDEVEHAAVIQAALAYRSVPARIQVVTSGEEALSYLRGEWPYEDRIRDPYPALVVLDHWLPEATGLEVLEWIRSSDDHADLPVVVFTACREPALKERCEELGVSAFRIKPDGFGELAETVRDVLLELLLGPEDGEATFRTG